ncbi:MAG: hypothetical protein Q9170_005428 [Blastenia crenularia]
MAEKPPTMAKEAAKDALPASQPKPAGNPAFRMMGLPNFRLKLPSRNWLIFLSITGSFTSAVLYDRYHKKKAQQRWCNLVSHIAQEPISPTQLPRRITVFLSAPPGDSLRAAREHFHEYIKPVLVAGALDWDVVEGRIEGDVRAGLAEKIRKRRKDRGERPLKAAEGEEAKGNEDFLRQLRDSAGIKESDDVQGDLILGRHTWKEYMRGLHEGWLGPLEPPPELSQEFVSAIENTPLPTDQPPTVDSISSTSSPSSTPETSTSTIEFDEPKAPVPKPEDQKVKEKPKPPAQQPSFISPSAYPTASLAPSTPGSIQPSTVVPFPHLLGFLNTPTRIYRFLNRRHLADDTGRQVATLVLASHVQSWKSDGAIDSSTSPDALPSYNREMQTEPNLVEAASTQQGWEQEGVLEQEERDWHKSAWQSREGDGERIWKERLVIDSRIGEQMRRFHLGEEDEKKAKKDDGVDPRAKGVWENFKEMIGWEEEDRGVKGWEQGLIGEESD